MLEEGAVCLQLVLDLVLGDHEHLVPDDDGLAGTG